MKPIDLKPLIEFAISLIALSLALGQYGKLQEFARKEAIKALESKTRLIPFFPENYKQ